MSALTWLFADANHFFGVLVVATIVVAVAAYVNEPRCAEQRESAVTRKGRPMCDSVEECPKCGEDTTDATKRFIIDGAYGFLLRNCNVCDAHWEETTKDTPQGSTHERDAQREIAQMLGEDAE